MSLLKENQTINLGGITRRSNVDYVYFFNYFYKISIISLDCNRELTENFHKKRPVMGQQKLNLQKRRKILPTLHVTKTK